jgi:hypothetical protein
MDGDGAHCDGGDRLRRAGSSVAQLGWVAGPFALAGFACVTYYTSTLLANAYRAPGTARTWTPSDPTSVFLNSSRTHNCLPFFSLACLTEQEYLAEIRRMACRS